MSINVNLNGAELATYLATRLSDLEFELLIRARINHMFDNVHSHNQNLSESHNECRFTMSWGDEAKWDVRIGENYSKNAHIEGQVLSNCMHDVYQLYMMKQGNKLSLLLPAPDTVKIAIDPDSYPADFDTTGDEDKKW